MSDRQKELKQNNAGYTMQGPLRSWAEVDLGAIKENYRNICEKLRRESPGTQVLCVVKADAYGHGAIPVSRCLEQEQEVFGFAVAGEGEALALREAGVQKPILILGYTFPEYYEELVSREIRITLFREDSLELLAQAARNVGRSAKVHVKVDTGMSRIGISTDDKGEAFLRKLSGYPELEVEGIFTHFARADEQDQSHTFYQYEKFCGFAARAEEVLGRKIPLKHCANSAGVTEFSTMHLDLVRPGIALYGVSPLAERGGEGIPLKPALSWYSRLVYVQPLSPGQSVSYGGHFTAQKDMRIATVAAGYGDGYPRSLSNRGYVLIQGRRAPILGRVCMDQFMVDVTEIPQAREGDLVTLLGKDGGECIWAEDLGALAERFHYELICDIGKRVPRVYSEK